MEIAKLEDVFRQIRVLDAALRSKDFVDSVARAIDDCPPTEFGLKSYSPAQFAAMPNGPGVYVFYIRVAFNDGSADWKHQFRNDWGHPDVVGFQHSPAIISSRLEKVQSFEWIPLYLGKSEHIQKRVLSHIELDGTKKTFALKLVARANKMEKHLFRVKYWHFGAFPGMQILLRVIEEELRERIEPITGRQ